MEAPDEARSPIADAIERLVADQDQELGRRLAASPVGSRLCVHPPEWSPSNWSLNDDVYRVTVTTRVHVLDPAHQCGVGGSRTEWHRS